MKSPTEFEPQKEEGSSDVGRPRMIVPGSLIGHAGTRQSGTPDFNEGVRPITCRMQAVRNPMAI